MKKWRNLFLATIAFVVCGFCAFACSSKQVSVAHADEVAEVVQEEEQPKEDWFQEKIDTFIVPLLSGVSIASIGSALFTVGFLIIKNRLSEKQNRAIRDEANEKYAQANETLNECKNILSEVHQIYYLTQQSQMVNENTKKFIESEMKYMVSVIDTTAQKVGKVDDLIKVVTIQTQLQTKIAKQSPELIKSGIIEDVNSVNNLIKNL